MKKDTKIYLIAIYSDIGMNSSYEEIGICSIASYMRSYGYEVKLDGWRKSEIDYEQIFKFQPDIIGFPVYSFSKKDIYEAVDKIKIFLPQTVIVTGGILATCCGNKLLEENNNIDVVIRGEGEKTFYNMVQAFEKKEDYHMVNGLTYRNERKEITENDNAPLIDDLDSLPFPSRDMLEKNKLKIAMISASRGCRAKCSFCASQLFWNRWRGRNISNVVSEIEMIHKQYNIDVFNFIDSSFEDPNEQYSRMKELVEEINKRELIISYFFNVRAEFWRKATPELIKSLCDSGLCRVCIGFEAGNEQDIKLYGKTATRNDNMTCVELFQSNEIIIEPGFINFNPYSTLETLKENICFLGKYKLADNINRIVSRLGLYKGTRICNQVQADSLVIFEDSDMLEYKFKHKEIGELYHYITKYVERINHKENFIFLRFTQYAERVICILTHLCHKYLWLKQMNFYEVLMKAKTENIALRNEFSDIIFTWFYNLLEVVEKNGYCEEKMNYISDQLLSIESLKKLIDQMDMSTKCTNLKLMRMGFTEIDLYKAWL